MLLKSLGELWYIETFAKFCSSVFVSSSPCLGFFVEDGIIIQGNSFTSIWIADVSVVVQVVPGISSPNTLTYLLYLKVHVE